jgi:hypothetical protein
MAVTVIPYKASVLNNAQVIQSDTSFTVLLILFLAILDLFFMFLSNITFLHILILVVASYVFANSIKIAWTEVYVRKQATKLDKLDLYF